MRILLALLLAIPLCAAAPKKESKKKSQKTSKTAPKKAADKTGLKNEEEKRIRRHIKKGALVVSLDAGGTMMSTKDLAAKLERWMSQYDRIQMMIGGPDGLSRNCLGIADGAADPRTCLETSHCSTYLQTAHDRENSSR